jgi:hypothetical protein
LVCYCKDCRAFAHYLGRPAELIDPQGGADIVVTHPQEIVFSSGTDAIACVSLSEAGMLRWYARCCNTPIGNTSRNKKVAYVGLAAACLTGSESLDTDVGPVRMRSCTETAKGKVDSSGLKSFVVMLGFARSLLAARLSGSYRRNPFFKPGSAEPVAQPTVLSKEEHARLRAID